MTTSQACELEPTPPERGRGEPDLYLVPEFFEAISDRKTRLETWAQRPAFASLDPYLSPNLKALRDHKIETDADIDTLGDLLVTYTVYSSEQDETSHRFSEVLKRLRSVGKETDLNTRALFMDMSLVDFDYTLLHVTHIKEVEVLNQPSVAQDFMREIITGRPNDKSDNLLEKMLEFEPALADIGTLQFKTVEWKTSELAKVSYYIKSSLTAKGVLDWLNEPKIELNSKTPYEVINQPQHDHHEHRTMMDLARRLNSGTAQAS